MARHQRRRQTDDPHNLAFWEGTPEGRVVSIVIYCVARYYWGFPTLPDPVLPGVDRAAYDRVVAAVDARLRQGPEPLTDAEVLEWDRLLRGRQR